MRRGTDTQTDTQTAVINIHFTLATPHAKCNNIGDNKWSKEFDIKPHRCSRRTVQSYSPGCANVPSHGVCTHLANMIELVFPSAHQSPQPKRQIDRFTHFCTAHGRKSLYFIMGRPPLLKIAPSHDGMMTHGSLAHPSPQPKRHLDRSAVLHKAHYCDKTDQETDRLTDHVTRPVTIGRIYVCSTAMRPNNNSNK